MRSRARRARSADGMTPRVQFFRTQGARGRSRLSPPPRPGDRVRNRPAPGTTGRRCACVETKSGDSEATSESLLGWRCPAAPIYAVMDGRLPGPPRPAAPNRPACSRAAWIRCSARPHRGWSGWPGERGDADGPARGLERALGHRAGDRAADQDLRSVRLICAACCGSAADRRCCSFLRSPGIPHGDPDLRPADPTRVLRSHPGRLGRGGACAGRGASTSPATARPTPGPAAGLGGLKEARVLAIKAQTDGRHRRGAVAPQPRRLPEPPPGATPLPLDQLDAELDAVIAHCRKARLKEPAGGRRLCGGLHVLFGNARVAGRSQHRRGARGPRQPATRIALMIEMWTAAAYADYRRGTGG